MRRRISTIELLVILGCGVWVLALAYPEEWERFRRDQLTTNRAPAPKPPAPVAAIPAPIEPPAAVAIVAPPADPPVTARPEMQTGPSVSRSGDEDDDEELTRDATGGDYLKASDGTREVWAIRAARLALPEGNVMQILALVVRIKSCLDVSLGVKPARTDKARHGKMPAEQEKARALAPALSLVQVTAFCAL